MTEENIRLEPDDYIPRLQSAGIAGYLETLTKYSPTIRDLSWEIKKFCIDNNLPYIDFTRAQIEKLISDLNYAGFLTSKIYGGSNASPTDRKFSTEVKVNKDEVFVDLPEVENFALRVYKEKGKTVQKKLTNKITLTELQVKTGEEVQVCKVVEGVVGWITKVKV